MKTILIMLVFVGRSWVPQYAVEYPDEKSCLAAQKSDNGRFTTQGDTKAVCIPKLLYKEGK